MKEALDNLENLLYTRGIKEYDERYNLYIRSGANHDEAHDEAMSTAFNVLEDVLDTFNENIFERLEDAFDRRGTRRNSV